MSEYRPVDLCNRFAKRSVGSQKREELIVMARHSNGSNGSAST
ncbi:hypothetical protein HTSR_0900 [Halodesulfurarchaeum formicicum]|uniref:Uncharacterized protein n=1 Tax=Halodesulfurarchaeum formicicum TaxID=1873524 RepID=A0A1D8S406_9EURY|nr:hypothetical protein HTSR_0900 [Halodesulfurarchaeum formicicum]